MRDPPAPAGAQNATAPARRPLSFRPKQQQLAPRRGRQWWAGPERRYAPSSAATQSPLPSHPSTGLDGVVVCADWLRRLLPRPISDRITWKHETRLRPPVVQLSGYSKRPLWVGGRRPGSLGGGCRVRMRRPERKLREENCSNPRFPVCFLEREVKPPRPGRG